MKKNVFILAILFLVLPSCQGQRLTDFVLEPRANRQLLPENIVLRVKNTGSSELCIPIIETRLDMGFISLNSDKTGDVEVARPPSTLLNGFDVSEGVYIIPSQGKRDIFINIGQEGKAAKSVYGVIRGVDCRSLLDFKSQTMISRKFVQKL